MSKFIEYSNLPYSVPRVYISDPGEFLSGLPNCVDKKLFIGDFQYLEIWSMVAIAALSRDESNNRIILDFDYSTVSKFAYAVGLKDVVEGNATNNYREEGRTVKIERFVDFKDLENVSKDISKLLISDDMMDDDNYIDAEDTRRTIYYVMVELMRNVVQHSYDKLGGVIAAQSMNVGGYHDNPCIQIAVADSGIGIYRSLLDMHRDIVSPEVALERSILPHYSGAFPSWKKGGDQNAGLGLFFASQMVKILGGRMLISSRGASLTIQGDIEGFGNNDIKLHDWDYPGTIVVFEIPKRSVGDYVELIKIIQSKAQSMYSDMKPVNFLRYDISHDNIWEFAVVYAAEDTSIAEKYANDNMIPRLLKGENICLNFMNIDIRTQSFLHALLFNVIKIAYANNRSIYIKSASDPVKDGLRFLENYALKKDDK